MGRKGHPLAARIKKMMQTDEDVGKIAQATPIMIARAMELFLQRLCAKAGEVAAGRKAKTLTCSHLKAYVSSDDLMDFLGEVVAKAPDLPPEGEAEPPKPKRQRTGEAKPRAPRGEGGGGRGKAKQQRESADDVEPAAAEEPHAAASAGEGEQQQQQAAAAPAAAAAAPAAAAAAPLPVPPHVKRDSASGSPTVASTAADRAGGFGGLSLGAHPFLASRTFGKPAAAAKEPGGALKPAAAAAAAAGGAGVKRQRADAAAEGEQQQQQQVAAAAAAAAAGAPEVVDAPSVLPGLDARTLAGFANQAAAEEDDYDDE